jgi:hypothetical protein
MKLRRRENAGRNSQIASHHAVQSAMIVLYIIMHYEVSHGCVDRVCKRPAQAESRMEASPPEDEIGDGRKLDEAD